MTEWTPTDDDIEGLFIAGWCCVTDPATAGARPYDAYRRWLVAHDQALREQVSRDLMEKLPRILAETSGDSFGWLSDGLYKDAEADSVDSEVYVRDGGIDLDQIAEYAARIVGGK